MLDLFGKHVEPESQLSGITEHHIAVNNVTVIVARRDALIMSVMSSGLIDAEISTTAS